MSVLMVCVLLLGVFEVASNGYHLSRGSVKAVGHSARRQHQELPLDLGEGHFFVKAIVMFVFGLLFCLVGVLFALGGDPQGRVALPVVALFAGYGLLQAVVYRRSVNVWPAAIVYSIPLVAFLLLRQAPRATHRTGPACRGQPDGLPGRAGTGAAAAASRGARATGGAVALDLDHRRRERGRRALLLTLVLGLAVLASHSPN